MTRNPALDQLSDALLCLQFHQLYFDELSFVCVNFSLSVAIMGNIFVTLESEPLSFDRKRGLYLGLRLAFVSPRGVITLFVTERMILSSPPPQLACLPRLCSLAFVLVWRT